MAFTVTGVVHVLVSLATKAPPARIQAMVEELGRKDSVHEEAAHV